MKDLLIAKTVSTPQIDFKSSGQMSIKGSLLPEDPKVFFKPLFNWIENTDVERLKIDVKLNYINTSSSKRIIELFNIIDRDRKFKTIEINWHYEADDSDMLEFGEMIQRNLKRTNTQYVECNDLDA